MTHTTDSSLCHLLYCHRLHSASYSSYTLNKLSIKATMASAMDETKEMEIDDTEPLSKMPHKKLDVTEVVIHPLVLLSVADHYHRVARGTRKRVVGILLGQVVAGKVDATNSFAVPFEEDSKNPVRIFDTDCYG